MRLKYYAIEILCDYAASRNTGLSVLGNGGKILDSAVTVPASSTIVKTSLTSLFPVDFS